MCDFDSWQLHHRDTFEPDLYIWRQQLQGKFNFPDHHTANPVTITLYISKYGGIGLRFSAAGL